jgi:hypothetical protein
MVNLSQIEGQIGRMFGSGPAGDPAAIRACAREFLNDAQAVREKKGEVEAHYRHLDGQFEGPAASRLAASMHALIARLGKEGEQLLETAHALEKAATHLQAEKSAFNQRVEHGRQQLIAQARAAEKH